MSSTFKIIKKTHSDIPNTETQLTPPEQLSNNEVLKYIKTIKMDTVQNIEAALEQLETYKHVEKDTYILEKLCIILAEVKKVAAELKISKTEGQKTKILEEFKKKHKKISADDFIKQIDLTAPKKDRQPDINTTIWKTSKDTIYVNPNYSTATKAQQLAFASAFRRKKISMDDSIKTKIKDNIEGNYTKLAIHKYEPDRLKYKSYNPECYTGLSNY